MNFAENEKWPTKLVWRAGPAFLLGGLMRERCNGTSPGLKNSAGVIAGEPISAIAVLVGPPSACAGSLAGLPHWGNSFSSLYVPYLADFH
jgi:hypothetical protein